MNKNSDPMRTVPQLKFFQTSEIVLNELRESLTNRYSAL